MAKKASDVEVVAGAKETAPARARAIRSAGPKVGGEAPLFSDDPETGCDVYRSRGKVVVEFERGLSEWSLGKRASMFACDLISANARQLPVVRRGEADGTDEIDIAADVSHAHGCVVVRFREKTKRWELSKLAAVLAVGLMRAYAKPLPVMKE